MAKWLAFYTPNSVNHGGVSDLKQSSFQQPTGICLTKALPPETAELSQQQGNKFFFAGRFGQWVCHHAYHNTVSNMTFHFDIFTFLPLFIKNNTYFKHIFRIISLVHIFKTKITELNYFNYLIGSWNIWQIALQTAVPIFTCASSV